MTSAQRLSSEAAMFRRSNDGIVLATLTTADNGDLSPHVRIFGAVATQALQNVTSRRELKDARTLWVGCAKSEPLP